MKKFYKIVFSIVTVFVLCLGLCLSIFNSSINASAKVISSDSVLVPSSSSFYNNYELLEYIYSEGGTNKAYINTGYNPTNNTSISAEYSSVSFSGNASALFGVFTRVNNSDSKRFIFNFGQDYSDNDLGVGFNTFWGEFTLNSISHNTVNKLEYNIDSSVILTVNSSTPFTYNFPSSSFSSSYPLYIFATNNSDSSLVDVGGSFKLYSFVIKESNNIVRNFVPARQKAGAKDVGLYDLVNNRFYTSPNGTDFTAGPTIYTVNFYNGSTLYNTQSFTNFNDFILPSNPSVTTGNNFLGWSFSNTNDIGSVVSPLSYINSNSNYPLNFYSVIVSDEFLAGYNDAKNIYDGFGPFLYSDYAFVVGNSINSFEVIPSLTGRVAYPDFIGYGGGVVLSDELWHRVDSYEYNNEIDTSLVFTFDTPVPVAKYTNFIFNGNFQFGNSVVFYFNDGTSYTFTQDMGLGNFVDLTSYNTKFITRIRLTYASSIGDYGQGIGLASNPSYLDSYNNGYTEGKEFGYNNGYSTGYREGNNKGYNNGYNAGLSAGSDYSFFGLFSALFDAPIATLTGLLNFELFGVNLLGLFLGLLTLAVILLVLRLIRGGK